MTFVDLFGYAYMAKILGVSRQAVRSWALGSLPGADLVRRIVKEFEVSYSDFYEYDE